MATQCPVSAFKLRIREIKFQNLKEVYLFKRLYWNSYPVVAPVTTVGKRSCGSFSERESPENHAKVHVGAVMGRWPQLLRCSAQLPLAAFQGEHC